MVADAKTNSPDAQVRRYNRLIGSYDNKFKKWETRTKRIIERFRDERVIDNGGTNDTGAKFNILWSNVKTLIPACFARLPQPDVSRRFKDNDPVGRVAALLLERALDYEIQHYPDYRNALTNCVQDRFLGGRGIAWVRYEPHIEPMDSPATDDGYQVTEDVENEGAEEAPSEYLDIECTPVDYVAWNDFGHEVARTWEEVNVLWRRVYMNRAALVERFGEELGNEIPLDTKPPEIKRTERADTEDSHQAVIYEIWDKGNNRVVWLSKSMNKVIDERTPGDESVPKLENFWPCPRPLYATTTTDTLVPVPDFSLYQDQANTLDRIARRIDQLVDACRVRGVYDAATPELARLFTEGANNTLIPVNNFHAFAEKNGLKGSIDLVDLLPIAQALEYLYKAKEQVKQEIYEITHIADILRGVSDPNETLGAQQMKGQFASMPLRDMQKEVEVFAQELIQIKAQIICAQYTDETILKIAGADQLQDVDKQLVPQALALLRNKPMRNFRIGVAADSMVQMDEQRERAERNELLQAVGAFLREALPMAQAAPQMVPLLMEMLKFAVAAYKAGKTLEGVIDQAADQLKQAAQQPQQPPPPDPAVIKAQNDARLQEQKMMMEAQFREREMQQAEAAEQRQLLLQGQLEAMKQKHEGELEYFRAQNDILIAQMQADAKAQTDLILARIDAMSKREVAHIGAEAQREAAERTAENQEISES